jgi:hypothetical protein
LVKVEAEVLLDLLLRVSVVDVDAAAVSFSVDRFIGPVFDVFSDDVFSD